MKSLIIILLTSITLILNNNVEIHPDSDAYTFDLKPFRAEYSQMGNKLDISTSFSPDESVYNIMMSMPDLSNSSQKTTDVIGISSLNGAFIYRNFQLPVPSWTYNKAAYLDGKVELKEYSEVGMKEQAIESKNPVFEGTFSYWQLSGIDHSETSFNLNRWRKTPTGLEVGPSATFNYNRKEVVTVNDHEFSCRVFVVELESGDILTSFVTDQPPYLIKQDYSTKGQVISVITLLKVSKD